MGLCYYASGMFYAAATDQRAVEFPEQEFDMDTSALPEKPTVDDWYTLAIRVLEAQDGQPTPDLVRIYSHTPCQSEPALDGIGMHFATFHFEGVWPSVKYAYMSLNRSSSKASVDLFYALMDWHYSVLDLSQVDVSFYEAFEIADSYAGQAFRKAVDDKCDIGFRIDASYIWKISYRKYGQPVEDWEIWVNAVTGEVERRQRFSSSK